MENKQIAEELAEEYIIRYRIEASLYGVETSINEILKMQKKAFIDGYNAAKNES